MRCLVQLGSLDFADGSTWQRAGDDLSAEQCLTQVIGLALVPMGGRECPYLTVLSGTYRAPPGRAVGGGYVFGSWVVHGAWLTLVTRLVTCILLW